MSVKLLLGSVAWAQIMCARHAFLQPAVPRPGGWVSAPLSRLARPPWAPTTCTTWGTEAMILEESSTCAKGSSRGTTGLIFLSPWEWPSPCGAKLRCPLIPFLLFIGYGFWCMSGVLMLGSSTGWWTGEIVQGHEINLPVLVSLPDLVMSFSLRNGLRPLPPRQAALLWAILPLR